jgi:hypothetical protein
MVWFGILAENFSTTRADEERHLPADFGQLQDHFE